MRLRARARELGGDAELISFAGEGHAFFLEPGNAKAQKARSAIVDFFAARLFD